MRDPVNAGVCRSGLFFRLRAIALALRGPPGRSQTNPTVLLYCKHMNKVLIALLLFVTQDTLRVKVSLVTVGVRVTDSHGRNVLGLKADDFSIFDDGIAQNIEFFSGEEQPITLGILLDRSFSMSYNRK